MSEKSPSLILATSNGIGMGHLARQLAIGLALAPRARVTLFSLSMALPGVSGQGIPGEYCPGPDRGWIPEISWPHYLAARLTALVEEVAADVVVFDGVAPYRGITLARARLPNTAFVWFRRGMWQPGVNESQLWKSELFDGVIEPGDLASADDRGATAGRGDALVVPPVSLVEVVEPLSRVAAARVLGLDPERFSVLLTLGSGRLGEVAGPGGAVLDALTPVPGAQIAVATSAFATSEISHSSDSRVVPLRGVFPLVRYLSAFDAAVSAAGYNAVHELIGAGLPTMLVPNASTRTDDQVGRAMSIARRGFALTATGDDHALLVDTARKLANDDTRVELREAIGRLAPNEITGGAGQTAEALIQIASNHVTARPSLKTRSLRARDTAKESIKRRLGPGGTNTVRKLIGRPPIPGAAQRTRVSLGDDPPPDAVRLHMPEDPTVEQLLGPDPIEHLLEGSSGAYRATRRLLIDRHYDVVD